MSKPVSHTIRRKSRTGVFTEVESQEDTNDASDHEDEPYKIKRANMFAECSTLVRIQVEEEEQESKGDSACWSETYVI